MKRIEAAVLEKNETEQIHRICWDNSHKADELTKQVKLKLMVRFSRPGTMWPQVI